MKFNVYNASGSSIPHHPKLQVTDSTGNWHVNFTSLDELEKFFEELEFGTRLYSHEGDWSDWELEICDE